MGDARGGFRHFLSELKRRNVYRVAVTYAVVAFVVWQIADLLFPALRFPPWTTDFVVVLTLLGFPVALVLAWAFEMTPEGVRRTPALEEERAEAAKAGGGAGPESNQFAVRALVGLGLLAAAAAGVWYLTGGGGEVGPRAGKRSIAVLPFENMGGQESQQFTQGVHDGLLTRLSNISGLKVISRTSVMQFRDTRLPLPAIADSLGVKWVMEGGVQKMGDQIQVNAQLIDPRTDTHAWAEQYRRDLTATDLFAIQSEITKRIAGSLEARLTPEEASRVERRPTENLEAYRLYVRGRSQLDTRTEEGVGRAVDLFRRAIEIDSSYALAWTGLADAWSLQEYYGYGSPPSLSRRRETIRRALEIAPDLAEAHASLGLLHMDRLAGPPALRALERALELQPGHAQARHWLAYLLLAVGDPDGAVEHASLAVELDPHFAAARNLLAEAHLAAGDATAALAETERAGQLQPGYSTVHVVEGLVLHHLDRSAEARRSLREALSLIPERETGQASAVRAVLGVIEAVDGDSATARQVRERLAGEGAHPFWPGLVSAALGERDRAFRHLSGTERWPAWPTFYARYFFPEVLDPLRRDPRWTPVEQRINESWGLDPDGSLPDSVQPSFELRTDG